LLPGEGEFDLAGLLRTLAATGTTAPLGVEVFNEDLQAHPAVEAALLAGQSTRRVLDAAR
jgi:sugar phosphate isomerase/epimerase